MNLVMKRWLLSYSLSWSGSAFQVIYTSVTESILAPVLLWPCTNIFLNPLKLWLLSTMFLILKVDVRYSGASPYTHLRTMIAVWKPLLSSNFIHPSCFSAGVIWALFGSLRMHLAAKFYVLSRSVARVLDMESYTSQ